MKKNVTVQVHLDNLVELKDLIQTDFLDKTFYVYPVFWYDNDSNRCSCSLCFTDRVKDFSNSITVFPPDVESIFDLYIQFGRLMELLKKLTPIFCIQPIEYRES